MASGLIATGAVWAGYQAADPSRIQRVTALDLGDGPAPPSGSAWRLETRPGDDVWGNERAELCNGNTHDGMSPPNGLLFKQGLQATFALQVLIPKSFPNPVPGGWQCAGAQWHMTGGEGPPPCALGLDENGRLSMSGSLEAVDRPWAPGFKEFSWDAGPCPRGVWIKLVLSAYFAVEHGWLRGWADLGGGMKLLGEETSIPTLKTRGGVLQPTFNEITTYRGPLGGYPDAQHLYVDERYAVASTRSVAEAYAFA